MKKLLPATGFLLLFAVEILRVYFIMPFPGSQHNNTIGIAYWIAGNIWWLRISALLLIALPLLSAWKHLKLWKKISAVLAIAIYGFIFYKVNFKFEADKMFLQPRNTHFANATSNSVSGSKLVIGVLVNGEAKAYPVEVIGYHHQVRDTVGSMPVMVTYCTVCRTGRVFSPVVHGKPETFRLVGMDHFNAMFEDATTKSWWQQATGEAIAGKLKGERLPEIASQQSTLASWLKLHPNSSVLQPDTIFKKDYDDLAGYDRGIIKSKLEKRDSASWQFKSWIIGVVIDTTAKAYDWNELVTKKILLDSLPHMPLLITLEKDTASFHVFSRNINGRCLQFQLDSASGEIKDLDTQSSWNASGACIYGPMKGQQLKNIQAYQEFWHSWQTFHPNTIKG